MHEMIQLLVSFTGSLGFAALFNIHGKKLWFAALGGCLSWAVYLIVGIWTSSPYICGFWSTVTITLYELVAPDSQDSGYSVSCLGNDSADSGSCPVPDHELDDDAGVG